MTISDAISIDLSINGIDHLLALVDQIADLREGQDTPS